MPDSKLLYPVTVLLSSLFLASFPNSTEDDTIIQINSRKIGFQEFRSRLNDLPQALKHSGDELKEILVCTLIAETILYYEGLNKRLDTLERVRLLLNQYCNEAIYEQWMDSEVRSQVKITDNELLSAYARFKERRSVAFWTVQNVVDANALRDRILKGVAPPQKPQHKEIEYAESLDSVENAIYTLEQGEVSKPLFIDGLYYVFQLLKKEPHPEYSKNSFVFWKRSIEKKVRARKEMSLADSRLDALMKGKKYSVRTDAYDFLLSQLYPAIYDKDKLKFELPEFIQQEIGSKEIGANKLSNQPLITFNDGGEWTVGDLWKKLSVSPYPLDYRNPEDLKNGLLDVIRRIILFESIIKQGKNKGYNNSSYVRYQSQMWGNNVLAQALVHEYRKTLSIDEKDLIQYYDSTKYDYLEPERRKIIPIIVREKETAKQLHTQIIGGGDIISLAEKYSVSNINLDRENPGLYITRDTWGEIGKVAFTLRPGQVSDPISYTDSTYAIIKLLEIKHAAPYPYDEIHGKLRSILDDRKLQQQVEEFLSNAVKNYDIKINRAALSKVEYFGGTMGVKKMHFPLRSAVPGFPLFNPKARWYKEGISKN